MVVVIAAAAVSVCGGPTDPDPTAGSPAGCPVPDYVPAPAGPWPCPSAAEVEAIRSDVPIEFEADPTAGTLVCSAATGSADLTRLQERTYQAIGLMRRLGFDAPLPWTGEELYPWFVHSVRGVRFRVTRYSFCCDPPGVINIAVHPDRDPSYGEGFPTLIEGLVHEARHAEGGHLHTCGNADQTLAELGAWGVQYYLNVWMALHALGGGLTPDDRAYCLNRAAFLAAYDFCTECPGVPTIAGAADVPAFLLTDDARPPAPQRGPHAADAL
jgi:hypothetical protein